MCGGKRVPLRMPSTKFAHQDFLAECRFYMTAHVLTPSSMQRPGFAPPGAKQYGHLSEPRKTK